MFIIALHTDVLGAVHLPLLMPQQAPINLECNKLKFHVHYENILTFVISFLSLVL